MLTAVTTKPAPSSTTPYTKDLSSSLAACLIPLVLLVVRVVRGVEACAGTTRRRTLSACRVRVLLARSGGSASSSPKPSSEVYASSTGASCERLALTGLKYSDYFCADYIQVHAVKENRALHIIDHLFMHKKMRGTNAKNSRLSPNAELTKLIGLNTV